MAGRPERLRELRAHFERLLDLDPAARGRELQRLAEVDAEAARELGVLLRRDAELGQAPTRSALDDLAVAIARDDPEPPLLGRRIGAYTVTGQLGAGGMGLVLAAERVEGELRQQVAIKLVRRDLLAPALLRRFSTERAVLAALEHPAICRFIDAGTLDDGTPYVVMERVRGSALLAWCDARRLDLAGRVRLFRQVVDAVVHAHRRLVVHRDIKLANVLVHEDGQPKLLDFGIAASLSEGRARTVTAERFFTPGHAAPEQLRGEAVGVACDLYGLGGVLYELLCGRPPFAVDGLRAAEIERLVFEVPPPPLALAAAQAGDAAATARGARTPGDLGAALRGDLDAIVQRCLRKDPSDRYPSAEQLDADLVAWLEQRPVWARGGDSRYRLRKFVRRNRTTLAAAVAVAAAVAGATGAFALQALDVRAQRDRAEQALRLLRDAFVEADPARASGTAVTAQQILASASGRLDALRDAQPELYADLATTLADVYLALGDAPRAAELSERAIAAWRQAHTAAPVPLALRLQRGDALLGTRRLDEVPPLLDEAAAAGQHGPRLDLLRARWQLLAGRIDEALAAVERLLPAAAALPPNDDFAAAVRLAHVEALRGSRRFEDALRSLEATLAWQRGALAEDHPRVIQTRLAGLPVLRRLGRFDEALAQATAVERLVAGAYGTRNSIYATALSALAQAQAWRGESARAIATYRQAAALWEGLLGPQHDNALRSRFNLARALMDAPDTRAEGIATLTELVARVDQALGPRHELSGFFRLSLADNLLEDGAPEAALEHLAGTAGRESLAGARGVNRSEHLRIADDAAHVLGCAAALDRLPPRSRQACADHAALRAGEAPP